MAQVFGGIAFPDFEQAIPIRNNWWNNKLVGITSCLSKTVAPEVQGSDSGGHELVIRDGVFGGYVTQTEYLITKYASESKLNKRNGNKLIALATRADFNPSEIRTDSIRQIELWVALANDPNAIQELDLLCASDRCQESTLYLRNLADCRERNSIS